MQRPDRLYGPVVQCAVNISEGRRRNVVSAIAAAMDTTEGARVADWSCDPDHNRSVISVLGHPLAVVAAVLGGACRAIDLIDIAHHDGVHPRLGVVDVVPFAPVRDTTMQDCVDATADAAHRLAHELGISVYLYERSAREGRLSSLPDIRRAVLAAGGRPNGSPAYEPDLCPPKPRASAGAAVVGARPRLVAYNVELVGGSVETARAVAQDVRRLRDRDGRLTGVRALGLMLASRRLAQVSMNLTQPDDVDLFGVTAAVDDLASLRDARSGSGEVIGLIRRRDLGDRAPVEIPVPGLRDCQIIDNWLGV